MSNFSYITRIFYYFFPIKYLFYRLNAVNTPFKPDTRIVKDFYEMTEILIKKSIFLLLEEQINRKNDLKKNYHTGRKVGFSAYKLSITSLTPRLTFLNPENISSSAR